MALLIPQASTHEKNVLLLSAAKEGQTDTVQVLLADAFVDSATCDAVLRHVFMHAWTYAIYIYVCV